MSLTPQDVRKIAKEESRKGNVDGLLSATIASAGIDGTITGYDIAIVAGLVVCVTFLSAFVFIGACLIGVPLKNALNLAGRTILTGVAIGLIRLLVDAINPLGFITEWNEFRDWKRDYYDPPESAVTIKLEIQNGKEWRFLHFDAEQTKKAVEFAREYLSLCDREDYPTAEKFYVGSGRIWSRSEADYATWQAFKASLFENRLAFEQGKRWHLTESGKRAMIKISEVEL